MPSTRSKIYRPALPLYDARRSRPARSRRDDLPEPGEWHPQIPVCTKMSWTRRAGRDAVYRLAALAVGSRLAVANG